MNRILYSDTVGYRQNFISPTRFLTADFPVNIILNRARKIRRGPLHPPVGLERFALQNSERERKKRLPPRLPHCRVFLRTRRVHHWRLKFVNVSVKRLTDKSKRKFEKKKKQRRENRKHILRFFEWLYGSPPARLPTSGPIEMNANDARPDGVNAQMRWWYYSRWPE